MLGCYTSQFKNHPCSISLLTLYVQVYIYIIIICIYSLKDDTENKRQELESVIEKRADGLEKLKSQTQLCAETEKFVAKVKEEKERLRKAKEHEMKREKSGIKIQAWWRGIMVRSCLGQFRKNKVLRTKLLKIQKDRAKNAAKNK